MKTLDIGWASFYNDTLTNFSKEFQNELSCQLKSRFDLMMGIENYADDNKFQLMVGMVPLKLTYQDGYGFGLIEIIDKYSFSRTLTFYWKSTDEINENAISSSKVNFQNIEFGWCVDFEKDYFLNLDRNKIVSDIQNKFLGFKYTANFELFPDLSFNFIFKVKPTHSHLEEIFKLMKKNFKKSYVSEITGDNNHFHSIVDFQNSKIEDAIPEIDQFMRDYMSENLNTITKSIAIN
jgi:hypothetical protein